LSFDDAADDPVLEPPPGQTPLWPTVVLRALFPIDVDLQPLTHVLAESCGAVAIRVETLDDARWQGAMRRAPAARRIGSRLWLGPADERVHANAGETHVRLHMGLAFGTGEHSTTALCLEWLEANLRADARVLDYGCGSGVLAIAALALGARGAWAVDNDPQALTATADNARLNGVAERLWLGPPEALAPVTADIVVANILAGPLVSLAAQLCGHAAPGGSVILSGVLAQQSTQVTAAYRPYCDHFAIERRGDWVRISADRRRE
jgi:ribosomal protein L11 methyltransferase